MKSKWLIIAVLAVGLVLRLLTLNSALSFDEFVQTKAVIEANEYGLDKYTEMNPLTTWTRLLVTGFLGISVWSIRITSLIFAILTALILYLLAKELYDKKTALWAVALLALSAWHMLVSTSISFDGTFLTFYTLLSLFCFVKFEKSKQKSWLVFAGIAFGLAVLTKYTGVLVFFALMAYSLIRFRNFNKTLKELFIVGFAGIAVFSIFPIIAFLFNDPSYFWISLRHGEAYFGGRTINPALLAVQYALALLWIGPVLLFGYLLGWKNIKKYDWLSHSLVFVIIAFYTFIVQDPFRPVERYFTVFLPALCLLSGKYFASLKIKKRHWTGFGVGFVILLAINFIINALPGKILPFYPKAGFINAVLSLNWNFFVPLTGDQGPAGLYIKFIIFAIAFITGFICLVFALFKKFRKTASVILLGAGLSLSVFVMAELALHPTSPDIGAVAKETASFVKSRQLSGPFYTFRDYAVQYYIGAQAKNIDFTDDADEVEKMLGKGGTLVVIDFPAIDKQGKLWQAFNRCELRATVRDKAQPFGYVFEC